LVGGFDLVDAVDRQKSEKTHELVDIGVAGVEPELVEGVGRGFFRVEPDGAGFGFAKLGAVGLGDQRQGQAEDVLLKLIKGNKGDATLYSLSRIFWG